MSRILGGCSLGFLHDVDVASCILESSCCFRILEVHIWDFTMVEMVNWVNPTIVQSELPWVILESSLGFGSFYKLVGSCHKFVQIFHGSKSSSGC